MQSLTLLFLSAWCWFIYPLDSCRGRALSGPQLLGAPQVAGMIMVTIGTAIALWCVFTFVFIGKGTPAPFDPPRKLVIRGPYRFVRNPMYIGAGTTLAGAALFYQSLSIFIYTGVFFLITHLFVVLYEEPTLRRTFGDEYEAYFRPRQPLGAEAK